APAQPPASRGWVRQKRGLSRPSPQEPEAGPGAPGLTGSDKAQVIAWFSHPSQRFWQSRKRAEGNFPAWLRLGAGRGAFYARSFQWGAQPLPSLVKTKSFRLPPPPTT